MVGAQPRMRLRWKVSRPLRVVRRKRPNVVGAAHDDGYASPTRRPNRMFPAAPKKSIENPSGSPALVGVGPQRRVSFGHGIALVAHHGQICGMNPSHYAESIEATTMLLRDAAPWLEKLYTRCFSERSAVEHSMSGCVFGNLIGDVLRRNRTLAQLEMSPACDTVKVGCSHAGRRRSDEAQRGPRREPRPQGVVGYSGHERGVGDTIPRYCDRMREFGSS